MNIAFAVRIRAPRSVWGEEGQALVELVLMLPVAVAAIVLVANVLIFASECARFDRAVCEYARANAGVIGSPSNSQGLPVTSILGYTAKGRFSLSVLIRADFGGPFDVREHVFTLRYRMFSIPALSRLGVAPGITLRRTKRVYIPHYRAGVVL